MSLHSPVRLDEYDNSLYEPGRGFLVQALWYFVGLPLLRCSLFPFSGARRSLLRLFGAHVGPAVVIKPGVRVKYPWRLSIGANSWIGEDCWIDNLAEVSVGSNVCISQGVYICTGNHDWSHSHFPLVLGPVAIGDCAWIGAGGLVAPGVRIGMGAVLTIGSVALRDIPDMEAHTGNPASRVRQRRMKTADGAWAREGTQARMEAL